MATDPQIMNDAELRAEVARLRAEIDAVDDWANGIQQMLIAVLPFLLRGHPDAEKVHRLLQQADDRYEELQAHPRRAKPGEPVGLYEAQKMMNRQLALLGVWPGVDPAQAAQEQLERYQRRGRG